MGVEVSPNIQLITSRIQKRIERLQPTDKRQREILLRIGMKIVNDAKLNVRRKNIIDHGRLMNSIAAKLETRGGVTTLTVAPFGVQYAAIQEFGAVRTRESMKAMFAKFNRLGKQPRPRRPGFTNQRHLPRPFLGPAFNKNTRDVVALLREASRG